MNEPKSSTASAFTTLLTEPRTFPPNPAFTAQANAGIALQEEAVRDVDGFWAARAAKLQWARPWDRVLRPGGSGTASWCVGGRLNVAVNCVDRHVESGRGDQVALHWISEPGDTRDVTYADPLAQ